MPLPSGFVFHLTNTSLPLLIPASFGEGIHTAYVLSLLTRPAETDDIFKQIYASLGFSIEQLMAFQEDDLLDDMYASVLSSTFFLGILIDQFFFTPFGYYLKFINPVYMLSYNMKKEMLYALESMDEDNDFSCGMFAPCSLYTVSRLGRQYFGLDDEGGGVSALPDMPADLLVRHLTGGLSLSRAQRTQMARFIHENSVFNGQKVYEILIKFASNKAYWKRIAFLGSSTLHDVYLHICYLFDIEPQMNYCFFFSEDENPFSAYGPNDKRMRAKNSMTTCLDDLQLIERQKCLLAIHNAVIVSQTMPALPQAQTVKFEMEIMNHKDREKGQSYPLVKSEGRIFQTP